MLNNKRYKIIDNEEIVIYYNFFIFRIKKCMYFRQFIYVYAPIRANVA